MAITRENLIAAFSSVKGRHDFQFSLTEDQLNIVEAVMNGKDAVGVLPTGSGKSMGFILPPLLKSHVVGTHFTALVISPLLALSRNQANDLRRRQIVACMIGGSGDDVKDISRGNADIIFSSPESLLLEKWQQILRNVYGSKLCVQVFDEAHCISEWGNDFRPVYRNVTELRSFFSCPALALTATLNKRIFRDLMNVLCLGTNTVLVAALPDRPNIFLAIRKSTIEYRQELKWVKDHLENFGRSAKKIIVYTRSINQCSTIFQWLWSSLSDNAYSGGHGRQNRMVEMFHAHIDEGTRKRVVEELPKADSVIRVIVCTIAFGMGIDIPDVSVVVLWGLPKTMLDYWQESGRCCRDRHLNGVSICYAYPSSVSTCSDMVMKNVTKTTGCIREEVLKDFTIESMKGTLPQKNKCDGDCDDGGCMCCYCRCCDNCMSTCTCPKKADIETLAADFVNKPVVDSILVSLA